MPQRARTELRGGSQVTGFPTAINEKPEVRSAEAVQLAEGNTGSAALVRRWPGFAVSKNPGTHVRPSKGPVRSPSGRAVVPGGRGKAESVIR